MGPGELPQEAQAALVGEARRRGRILTGGNWEGNSLDCTEEIPGFKGCEMLGKPPPERPFGEAGQYGGESSGLRCGFEPSRAV